MANDSRLKCSIEVDESWTQEGCHWTLDRTFYLKYEVLDSSLKPTFHYTLNTKEVQPKQTDLTYQDSIYTYRLTWAELSAAVQGITNNSKDCLYLTAVAKVSDTIFSSSESYAVKLPPQLSTDLAVNLVTTNPGEVKCSWTQPEEDYDINEARGYCIEIFHRPEGEEDFTQLNWLRWNTDALAAEKYYIEKSSSKEEIAEFENSFTDLSNIDDLEDFITNNEITFTFQKPDSELYIENPEITEFYFMPKQLGIKPGDEYLFRVHPYNVYCSHFVYDDESHKICGVATGALLTSEGSEMESKVSKGIVRIKAPNDRWVEGQVWVYAQTTEGLKWIQAEAVYAMADDGTGKGVWKEAQ